MVQRQCIEAFDRSLRDIMHCNRDFGGKCVLMGGDFRQILPVIPKGNRAAIIDSCINSSYLWEKCTVFHLKKNMRLLNSGSKADSERISWFSNWLLSVDNQKWRHRGWLQVLAADHLERGNNDRGIEHKIDDYIKSQVSRFLPECSQIGLGLENVRELTSRRGLSRPASRPSS